MSGSTSIGSMSAHMTVSNAKWSSGLKKSESELTAFVGKAKNLLGALGVGLSVGSLIAFGRDTLNSIDSMAKWSDQIGTSTEFLVGLAHAGDLAGLSTEELVSAFTFMGKNLGAAATSGGDAAIAFEQIGLSVEKLQRMKPEDQFLAIGDAINKLPTASDKLKAVTDVFGRGGRPLLSLFSGGSEGIMKEMKGVFTYTREQAAAVEMLNDKWNRVVNTIKSAGASIAVDLAPRVDGILEQMEGFSKSGGFRAFVDILNPQRSAIPALEAYLDAVFPKSARSQEAMQAGGAGPSVLEAVAKQKKLADSIGSLEKQLQGEIATFGMASDQLAIYKLKVDGATDAQLAQVQAFANYKANLQATTQLQAEAIAVFNSAQTPFQTFAGTINQINGFVAAGVGVWEDYAGAVVTAFESLDKNVGKADSFRSPSAALAGSADALASLARNESRGATSGQNIGEALKNATKESTDLQKQQLRKAEDILHELRRMNLPGLGNL